MKNTIVKSDLRFRHFLTPKIPIFMFFRLQIAPKNATFWYEHVSELKLVVSNVNFNEKHDGEVRFAFSSFSDH